MIVAGCELKQGNSGAAVIDSKGRVKGLLRAVVKNKLTNAFYFNVMTSFSCAPVLPGLGSRKLPDVCKVLAENKAVTELFHDDVGDPPGYENINNDITHQVAHKDDSKDLPAELPDSYL